MLTRRIALFCLCALFIAALAARVSTVSPLDSPYFEGTSAMSYRHMLTVSQGGTLSAHDDKAAHPAGYVPDRYRAAGAETLTGLAYRAVSLVSDIDGRPFTRRVVVFMAALCVLTAYAVASRLWHSRGAGLLAAFLVAFLPGLVSATNGRVFSHVVFASCFASLYAALALRSLPSSSPVRPVLAVLASLPLLWVWEPARYGLAAWMAAVSLAPGVERRTRIVFVVAQAATVVAAAMVMPHLAAVRAAGAWTTAVALAAAVVAVLPPELRRGWRAPVYFVAGAALLTLAATPLRAGATEQFPALDYVLTRLRYLSGRPQPSLLSEWMRHLWSEEHAPLPARRAVPLLLPIVLCAVAWIGNRRAREGRGRFAVCLGVFVVAAMAALADRSIVPAAAVVMIVMVSGAAAHFDWRRPLQAAMVALAGYAALAGVVFAGKPVDLSGQVARAVSSPGDGSFVWISFENTDRDLVRFIATRTSVRECILAPEDLSGLLLAFTGRTVTLLPGTTSRGPSLRHVELTRALYGDETSLYELCRREAIDYVLYSVDVTLDTSPYAPARLAASGPDPASIATRMHFDPESLRHFTLIFENDHYRLFRVSADVQPVFLTDHPLFYQPELFVRDGRSIDHFREHVVWLMSAYSGAVNLRAAGRAEEARRILDTCVRQAPKFTRARLALADALMDEGRYEAARDQVAAVIQYAPDNPTALYAAAHVQVLLEHPEAARPFLQLLAQTGDAAAIEKGRALQYYIDNKIPLKPGAPR